MSFNIGNLYDFNKDLMKKTGKVLKGKALTNKINDIVIPYVNDKKENSYFMLLCHDKRDYTVFNVSKSTDSLEDKINKLVSIFKECLLNRGSIYDIILSEDKVALEIWIDYDNSDMVCYYFFPYDNGIIEV